MAMQVTNPKRPEHMRAFNPDRDMIWALPRLMSRVFHMLGTEWSMTRLTEMLEERGAMLLNRYRGVTFDASTEDIVTSFAKMFNLMQQFPEKTEAHAGEYKRLKELDPAFVMLLGSLLMDAIFAELPTWFDQVRPQSKLAPVPAVEEVERAAREFLDRVCEG